MIVFVAGVSGSGKTTVGLALSQRLGWEFTDGDSLHPHANIAKMSAGIALTDADRVPWLRAIADWRDERLAASRDGVLACSALKRSYRAQLLDDRPGVQMAFLRISRELAAQRLAARHGHFFDPHLLDSQFGDLEPPAPEENSVTQIPVTGSPGEIVGEIVGRLGLPG